MERGLSVNAKVAIAWKKEVLKRMYREEYPKHELSGDAPIFAMLYKMSPDEYSQYISLKPDPDSEAEFYAFIQ